MLKKLAGCTGERTVEKSSPQEGHGATKLAGADLAHHRDQLGFHVMIPMIIFLNGPAVFSNGAWSVIGHLLSDVAP